MDRDPRISDHCANVQIPRLRSGFPGANLQGVAAAARFKKRVSILDYIKD